MSKRLWNNSTVEQIQEDLQSFYEDAISGKGELIPFIDFCNHYMIKLEDTPERYKCLKCGFSC